MRDEERDSLFLALVLSMLAVALIQVGAILMSLMQIPSGLIPMDRETIIATARNCYHASRRASVEAYEKPPVIDLIILRFFDCVYAFLTGQTALRCKFR